MMPVMGQDLPHPPIWLLKLDVVRPELERETRPATPEAGILAACRLSDELGILRSLVCGRGIRISRLPNWKRCTRNNEMIGWTSACAFSLLTPETIVTAPSPDPTLLSSLKRLLDSFPTPAPDYCLIGGLAPFRVQPCYTRLLGRSMLASPSGGDHDF